MATVQILVQGSDRSFTIDVDPPPAIGSQFSQGSDELYEVVQLEETSASEDTVRAVVRRIDGEPAQP